MGVVLKISKLGSNVLTAGNADLAFSSELATHSIYNIIEGTISGTDKTTSISHNLGFIPKTWVFVLLNDGSNDYLVRIPSSIDNEYDYYVTDSDLIISRYYASGTDTFRAIIFTRSPNP